jgi:hypothetical protein
VGAGAGVATAEGPDEVLLGLGCAVVGVGVSTADSLGVAPAIASEAGTDWLGLGDAVATTAGVPTAPSTAPVGWNGVPMMNTRTTAARTTAIAAIAAIGAPQAMRRSLSAGPRFRPTAPVAAAATVAPQPGHAPPDRAQHLPHANTPQDEHGDSRIPARVAAGPIRLPHRSQNGRARPVGRTGLPEIIGNGGEPPASAGPECHHDPRHP